MQASKTDISLLTYITTLLKASQSKAAGSLALPAALLYARYIPDFEYFWGEVPTIFLKAL